MVMFSLFPSPHGRKEILTMENKRRNYSRVYVSRGVLDGNLAEKDTGLNGNKLP